MEKIVYVLDHDGKVRQSLVRLLRSAGHAVTDFLTAESFLA